MHRRQFLMYGTGLMSLSLSVLAPVLASCSSADNKDGLFFDISLAQWSMHRQLRNGQLDVLDFAVKTRQVFDIDAVEYVNQFFKDKAKNRDFLQALKTRADDNGVKSLLIMIDAEGELGDADNAKRKQSVENHFQWVEAAQYLGCHSIRVNATGQGSAEEVHKNCVEGLTQLCEFASDYSINIIIENHGGYSSNGTWLSQLIRDVAMPNCGSLPDFGNFGDYDRYQGVKDLMPFAKGISAKSFDFDKTGREIHTDFQQMLQIIKAANYRGYIGIEYEGSGDEDSGIMSTRDLLMTLGRKMS